MSASTPGTCYKFTVRSAAEAAQLIREHLGDHARVLSVRTLEASGLSRFWSAPRLEVIAQHEAPPAAPEAAPEPAVETPDFTASPAGNPLSRLQPPAADLRTLLLRAGFSEMLLARLTQSPAWAGLAAQPLHRGLVETGRHLLASAAARGPVAPLTRAAFIGLPGAGRTTALCKWLALETFRRGRRGHVITAEFDRPHPLGALPVFCEALGVPVAHHPALTQPATPDGFVYFDLPGIALRDPAANAPLARFLEAEAITQRVLVLNAAYDQAVLRTLLAVGCDLGATHAVYTHLDEVTGWGRLWDFVLDGGLIPLLLTTGPSLTGDCEDNVLDALVRRTLPVAETSAPAAASAA